MIQDFFQDFLGAEPSDFSGEAAGLRVRVVMQARPICLKKTMIRTGRVH
jgi:hypothetical protein